MKKLTLTTIVVASMVGVAGCGPVKGGYEHPTVAYCTPVEDESGIVRSAYIETNGSVKKFDEDTHFVDPKKWTRAHAQPSPNGYTCEWYVRKTE